MAKEKENKKKNTGYPTSLGNPPKRVRNMRVKDTALIPKRGPGRYKKRNWFVRLLFGE